MAYRGQVRKGVVVLDKRVKLEEGTQVTVRPIVKARTEAPRKIKGKTLLERLDSIAGKATGLPENFARNHDHYLHGILFKHIS